MFKQGSVTSYNLCINNNVSKAITKYLTVKKYNLPNRLMANTILPSLRSN